MVPYCYKYAIFNMNIYIQNDIKEYFHQLLICFQRSNKNITLKNYDQISKKKSLMIKNSFIV